MSKVLIIFGTRPELIKLAPVISEFKKRNLQSYIKVLNTNQHRDLLSRYMNILEVEPDHNLSIMSPGQSLSELTAKAILELQAYLTSTKEKNEFPEYILAQGDTNTVLASSIISFFNNIKFAHLEAGLRTFDFTNPFPEEYNRKIASIAADVHFAPTKIAKDNLIKEGIDGEKILVVGNTVVDSLLCINKYVSQNDRFESDDLSNNINNGNTILITCHRRENHGKNLQNLVNSISKLSAKYKEFNFIWILHPNPEVRKTIDSSGFIKSENVFLMEPLNYLDMIRLYKKVKLIITDSGGIQEEAPSFGIPVLVIGKKTERMESILEEYSHLAGTEENEIISSFEKHLQEKFNINKNPYGDGLASKRIVDYFEKVLNS